MSNIYRPENDDATPTREDSKGSDARGRSTTPPVPKSSGGIGKKGLWGGVGGALLIALIIIARIGIVLRDDIEKIANPPARPEAPLAVPLETAPLTDEAQERKAITDFFKRMSKDSLGSAPRMARYWVDFIRLGQRIARLGGDDLSKDPEFDIYVRTMHDFWRRDGDNPLHYGGFDKARIERMTFDPERSRAQVRIAWRTEPGAAPTRNMYWMVKTTRGWRVYDFGSPDFQTGTADRFMVLQGPGHEDRLDWFDEALPLSVEDPGRAMPLLTKAAKAGRWDGPYGSLLLIAQARAQHNLGRYGEALKLLDQASKVGHDCPWLHERRAWTLLALGRLDDALAQAHRVEAALPQQCDTQLLLGDIIRRRGHPDQAMKHYRKALEDDPTNVLALSGLALTLPQDRKVEAGKVLLEAPPDRSPELFDGACWEVYNGGDYAALAALVDAYAPQQPDDPNVAFYRSKIAYRNGDYARAATLIRNVMDDAKDREDSEYFYAALVEAALAAGEDPVEVYRQVPETQRQMWMLDSAAGYLRRHDRADDLEQLLKLHLTHAPSGPNVGFWRGVVHYMRGQRDQAETRWIQALEATSDQDQLSRDIRYERRRNRYEQWGAVKAYRAIGPASEAFDQLARICYDAGDGESLLVLVEAHRRAEPQARTGYWKLQGLYLSKRYDKVVEMIRDEGDRIFADWEDDYPRYSLEFRALLRLDRLDEAMAVARKTDMRWKVPWFQLILHVVNQDADKALATAKALEAAGGHPRNLYDDSDAGEILRKSPALAALREAYPEPEPEPKPAPASDPTQ